MTVGKSSYCVHSSTPVSVKSVSPAKRSQVSGPPNLPYSPDRNGHQTLSTESRRVWQTHTQAQCLFALNEPERKFQKDAGEAVSTGVLSPKQTRTMPAVTGVYTRDLVQYTYLRVLHEQHTRDTKFSDIPKYKVTKSN